MYEDILLDFGISQLYHSTAAIQRLSCHPDLGYAGDDVTQVDVRVDHVNLSLIEQAGKQLYMRNVYHDITCGTSLLLV